MISINGAQGTSVSIIRGMVAAFAMCTAVGSPAMAAGSEDMQQAAPVEALLQDFGLQTGGDLSAEELADLADSSLIAVIESLRKCRRALGMIELNEQVVKILSDIAKKAGSERFVTLQTVSDLEQAAGRTLNLTDSDLEKCVRAYDAHNLIETNKAQAPLPGVGCAQGQDTCVANGNSTCCDSSSQVCAATCDNGEEEECFPFCEPRLCFPADAIVREEGGGIKAMKDVAVGDQVQVVMADGSLGYEEVYMLTHKDPTISGPFIEIDLASGQSLTMSPRHFIPTARKGLAGWGGHILKGADEIRVGDIVWHQNGDGTIEPTEVTA